MYHESRSSVLISGKYLNMHIILFIGCNFKLNLKKSKDLFAVKF